MLLDRDLPVRIAPVQPRYARDLLGFIDTAMGRFGVNPSLERRAAEGCRNLDEAAGCSAAAGE